MFIEGKDDGSGGDNWSNKSCKAPVKSSPPTNQHQVLYRPDALPVAQPTASKHWRDNIVDTAANERRKLGLGKSMHSTERPSTFLCLLHTLTRNWSQYTYNTHTSAKNKENSQQWYVVISWQGLSVLSQVYPINTDNRRLRARDSVFKIRKNSGILGNYKIWKKFKQICFITSLVTAKFLNSCDTSYNSITMSITMAITVGGIA